MRKKMMLDITPNTRGLAQWLLSILRYNKPQFLKLMKHEEFQKCFASECKVFKAHYIFWKSLPTDVLIEVNEIGSVVVQGTEKTVYPIHDIDEKVRSIFPKAERNGMGSWKTDPDNKKSVSVVWTLRGLQLLCSDYMEKKIGRYNMIESYMEKTKDRDFIESLHYKTKKTPKKEKKIISPDTNLDKVSISDLMESMKELSNEIRRNL